MTEKSKKLRVKIDGNEFGRWTMFDQLLTALGRCSGCNHCSKFIEDCENWHGFWEIVELGKITNTDCIRVVVAHPI